MDVKSRQAKRGKERRKKQKGKERKKTGQIIFKVLGPCSMNGILKMHKPHTCFSIPFPENKTHCAYSLGLYITLFVILLVKE